MPHPEFRIVLDENSKRCIYASTKRGAKEASINLKGACILEALSLNLSGDERRDIYTKHKDFILDCFKMEILDENLKLRGIFRRTAAPTHLKLLQIETLLRCNLKCPYCYCSAGKERTEILSFGDLSNVLQDADRLGLLEVDFTGGEFFLRSDWRELVLEARKYAFGISIHTNGMALTQATVDFLADNNVRRIQVSVDGMNAHDHNAIRGHQRSFQLLEAGIERARNAGVDVVMNLMIHKSNVHDIKGIYHHFAGKGFGVIVDWIAPFGMAQKADLGLTLSEYIEALLTVPELRELIDKARPCGRDLGLTRENLEPHCGVGQSYMFLTATGEMAICPTLTSRESQTEFGGPTLAETSLYDAWMHHPYFDRHRFINCSNVETCIAGTECRGGCRATAYIASKGDARSPDVIECNRRKNETMKFVDFHQRYEQGEYGIVHST